MVVAAAGKIYKDEFHYESGVPMEDEQSSTTPTKDLREYRTTGRDLYQEGRPQLYNDTQSESDLLRQKIYEGRTTATGLKGFEREFELKQQLGDPDQLNPYMSPKSQVQKVSDIPPLRDVISPEDKKLSETMTHPEYTNVPNKTVYEAWKDLPGIQFPVPPPKKEDETWSQYLKRSQTDPEFEEYRKKATEFSMGFAFPGGKETTLKSEVLESPKLPMPDITSIMAKLKPSKMKLDEGVLNKPISELSTEEFHKAASQWMKDIETEFSRVGKLTTVDEVALNTPLKPALDPNKPGPWYYGYTPMEIAEMNMKAKIKHTGFPEDVAKLVTQAEEHLSSKFPVSGGKSTSLESTSEQLATKLNTPIPPKDVNNPQWYETLTPVEVANIIKNYSSHLEMEKAAASLPKELRSIVKHAHDYLYSGSMEQSPFISGLQNYAGNYAGDITNISGSSLHIPNFNFDFIPKQGVAPSHIPFKAPEAAKRMGLKQPAAHGTVAEFHGDAFLLPHSELGTHFGTPKAAEDILSRSPHLPADAKTFPVVIKTSNPIRMPDLGSWGKGPINDWMHSQVDKYGSKFPFDREEITEAYKKGIKGFRDLLEKKGFDSVVYKNKVEDPGSDSYIIFKEAEEGTRKAAGIRSLFAKFDPKKINDPSLVAAIAGGGIIVHPVARELQKE